MSEKRSAGITKRPYSKALVKACGYTDEEIARPLIAVVNTWNEMHPGHVHLRGLAEAVKAGVRIAGGTPFETNTISLCDGIRTPQSNKYILPSREVIADSIELVAQTYQADGMVLLSSCDKIEPACLMAAARVDIPTIIVTGGAMLSGVYRGSPCTGVDMDVAGTGYRDGKKVSPEEMEELVECICETPGGCFGMGTANTMACLTEAIGMSLPYMACTMAADSRKVRMAKLSGMAVMELVRNCIKPSVIMSRAALYNAMRVNEAIGGSTNTFLHLPALAHELGMELDIEEFDRLSKSTPHICNMQPSGPYNLKDLRDAGGIPAVMKELEHFLDGNAVTVTGKTLRENISAAQIYNREVIRPIESPVHSYGGHAVLRGNIAPDGCVIKQIGCPAEMLSHRGPARVFEDGDEALEAVRQGKIQKGEVLVIRYEGPRGGPGMREMVDLTRTLFTLNLEKDVALVTDGRFSGYSKGAVFGHVSPEAQDGGPIAIVCDGDIISYDIGQRTICLELSDDEIKRRLSSWAPKKIAYKGYLKRYSQNVSSGCSGAVLK